MRPRHYVRTFDAPTLTGECSVCGPGAAMVLRARRGDRVPCCALARRQYRGAPGAGARARRWDAERRDHGLTRAEATAYVEGKPCAICGRTAEDGVPIVVDHCHTLGHVRGALCGPCNRALGLLGDDPERVEAAARYLRST